MGSKQRRSVSATLRLSSRSLDTKKLETPKNRFKSDAQFFWWRALHGR
jgi:hypothetical protein